MTVLSGLTEILPVILRIKRSKCFAFCKWIVFVVWLCRSAGNAWYSAEMSHARLQRAWTCQQQPKLTSKVGRYTNVPWLPC